MSVSRAIYAGIVATLVAFLYCFLTDSYLFAWIYQIMPGGTIWNEINAAWHVWNIVILLVANILLACIYVILQGSVPGEKYSKGFIFGIIVWIIYVLPASFTALLTMKVHITVPIYWVLNGLVKYIFIGLIFGGMLTKS